jgi:hypothetical protein
MPQCFFFHQDGGHLNYIFLLDHELYKGKANEVKYLYISKAAEVLHDQIVWFSHFLKFECGCEKGVVL